MLRWDDVPSPARNVVAILPGSDPKLKGEYVALGAHNDHIGFNDRAGRSRFAPRFQHGRSSGGRGRSGPSRDGRGEREDSRHPRQPSQELHKPRSGLDLQRRRRRRHRHRWRCWRSPRRSRKGHLEAEALAALRLARRRGEGALGLRVFHRSSHRAARLDRGAAQHGHDRARRRRRT